MEDFGKQVLDAFIEGTEARKALEEHRHTDKEKARVKAAEKRLGELLRPVVLPSTLG